MIWKRYIAPSWWLVQAIYTSKFSCWISSSSRKPCIKTWAVQWQGFSSVAKNTSCLDELFFVVSFLGSPGSIPACFLRFAVKFINKMWELPLWNERCMEWFLGDKAKHYLMWLNVLQDAPAWTIGIMGPMPWIQPKGDECDGKSPISSQKLKFGVDYGTIRHPTFKWAGAQITFSPPRCSISWRLKRSIQVGNEF